MPFPGGLKGFLANAKGGKPAETEAPVPEKGGKKPFPPKKKAPMKAGKC